MADTDILRIPVDTRQVDRGTAALNNLDRAGTRADTAVGGLARSFAGLVTAGAVLATITKAVTAFRDFEKGLVGVGKTAGIAGNELKALGDDITALSLSIPVTTAELSKIAQSAGQLGIKGSKNIIEFTEVIAMLGRSSNLAGEEAATALARILTVTGEGIQEAGRLASQIVALGNNFATTEAEIAKTAGEVARATSIFKLGSGNVAAISATMAQIGVSSELAGSAVGRTFRALDATLREGGKSLERLSEITGQTSEQLIETFGKSKITVFNQFLQGLKNIADGGGDTTAVLAEFDLKGEEILKTIPSLALAIDELTKALKITGDQATDATALYDEFGASLKTLDSNIILLGNTFDAVLVKVGAFITEFFKLNEASKSLRQALVLMFDLPESATMLREQIAEIKKELEEAQKPGFLERTFGTGITRDRENNINRLTGALAQLNGKLNALEKKSDTAEKAVTELTKSTEQLDTTTKKATISTAQLDKEYERGLQLLAKVRPKLRETTDSQNRLTQAQREATRSWMEQAREINNTDRVLRGLSLARGQDAISLDRSTTAINVYNNTLSDQETLLRRRQDAANDAFGAENESIEETINLLGEIGEQGENAFNSILDVGTSVFEELAISLDETLVTALDDLSEQDFSFDIDAFMDFSQIDPDDFLSQLDPDDFDNGQLTITDVDPDDFDQIDVETPGIGGIGNAIFGGSEDFDDLDDLGGLGFDSSIFDDLSDIAGSIFGGLGEGLFDGLGADDSSVNLAGFGTGLIDGLGDALFGGLADIDESLFGGAGSKIFSGLLGGGGGIVKGLGEKLFGFSFGGSDGNGDLGGVEQALIEGLEGIEEALIEGLGGIDKTLGKITGQEQDFSNLEKSLAGGFEEVAGSMFGIDKKIFDGLGKIEGVLGGIDKSLINSLGGIGEALSNISSGAATGAKAASLTGGGELGGTIGGAIGNIILPGIGGVVGGFLGGLFDKDEPDPGIAREAEEKRLRELDQLVTVSLAKLNAAVAKERSILNMAANDTQAATFELTSTLQELDHALRSLKDTEVTTKDLASAQGILQAALDFARTGGDISQFEGINEALQTASMVDTNIFSSLVDFERAKGISTNLIESLIAETGNQLSLEEQTLDSIEASVERLDAMLEESRNQVDALRGIDSNTLTIGAALNALGSAFEESGGTFSVPSFATGTNVVPFDTVANVHKGERIIPAADNRQLINNLKDGEGTVVEMRKLRQDMVALNTSVVLNTGKMRRIMERQDAAGIPPERIPA